MKALGWIFGAVVLLGVALFLLFKFVLGKNQYQAGAVPGQATGSSTASVLAPTAPQPAATPTAPSWLSTLFGGGTQPQNTTTAAQHNQSDGVVNLIGQGLGLIGSLFGNGNNTPQATYSTTPDYGINSLYDDQSDYSGGILDYFDSPEYTSPDQGTYWV